MPIDIVAIKKEMSFDSLVSLRQQIFICGSCINLATSSLFFPREGMFNCNIFTPFLCFFVAFAGY